MLLDGTAGKVHEIKAVHLLQEASSAGNDDAKFVLAVISAVDRNARTDLQHSDSLFSELSVIEDLDAELLYYLGEIFTGGFQSIEKNRLLGLECLKRASNRGSNDASYALANIYRLEDDVSRNDSLSNFYFKRAANQGNAKAQKELEAKDTRNSPSPIHDSVKGLPVSLPTHLDDTGRMDSVVYHPTTDPAHFQKMFDRAVQLTSGQGAPRMDSLSISIYTSLAEQEWLGPNGENPACSLGVIYANGYGVETSDSTATKWFAQAAKQGSEFARKEVSRRYAQSVGVEQNDSAALYWSRYSIAREPSVDMISKE